MLPTIATPAKADFTADSDAIHLGPCTKQVRNRNVTLEIDPKPVMHMKELTFRVRVTPADGLPANLALDLGMPGMMMGKNQVNLIRKTTGTWEGKGIIVKCRSGRTLWKATILSPELANPGFTFNVRN